jgi:hypothetical protein
MNSVMIRPREGVSDDVVENEAGESCAGAGWVGCEFIKIRVGANREPINALREPSFCFISDEV